MKLYYNLTSQCRVDEDNCRLTGFPIVYYGTAPVWELQLYQGALGAEPGVPDVSGLTAWRAAVDIDWTSGTEPMCRTVEGIDVSRAAAGLLTIPLNANTITFADALNGKKSLNGFFELRGFNQQGAVEHIILFGVTLHNAIDPEGGVSPETVSPDTITRAEVMACLRAPDERQYTSDPSDPSAAHASQTNSDTHTRRRNASAAGEWGPWEALVQGPKGDKGDTGAQGPKGDKGDTGATGPAGQDGADGQLIGASQTVSSLTSGYIVVEHDAIPVALKTDLGNLYPVEKGTYTISSGAWQIDPAAYLAYDGSASFTGPWTVYFAGGVSPLDTAYVYGIDYNTSVATAASACTRVLLNLNHDRAGDSLRYTSVPSFTQMPAHEFKRCVMSDLANRTVAYYLNASDSTKKADGTAADLTGGDGDVMVEIPVCHYRIDHYTDASGNEHNVYLVSDRPFTGSAIHRFFYTGPGGATARIQYVGAFRDVLCDSSGEAKAQSDESTPASYASGDMFRSIAGVRPHGNTTRANYRTGSGVNGGTNINSMFGQFLMMMMAIDGCTFDTQSSISYGYSMLTEFQYAAMRKTGRTAVFGNGTGEVLADETESTGEDLDLLTMKNGGTIWNSNAARKVVQFSYRGIEDPYGSQFYFEDGIQKYQNASDFTESGYWCTNDTSKYSLCDSDMGAGTQGSVFPSAGYTGASCVWVSHAFPKAGAYVKEFDPLTFFALSVTGGSSTTYLCDNFYNDALAGARVVYRGGRMNMNNNNGMAFIYVPTVISYANAPIGCRIAC